MMIQQKKGTVYDILIYTYISMIIIKGGDNFIIHNYCTHQNSINNVRSIAMKRKLLASLLGTAILLQSGSYITATASESDLVHVKNCVCENDQGYICSEKPLHLICTNEDEKEYSHGSVIRKKFEIESFYDIEDYEITVSSYDGVEKVKEPTYKMDDKGIQTVEIDFKVLDSCEIGSICFTIKPLTQNGKDTLNQLPYEKKIFCYHDSEYDYVSTVNLDCLSNYSEKLRKILLNIDRQGEYIENDKHNIQATRSGSTTSYSLTVAGYISWTDNDGGVHSAENVKVELYAVNDLTETYLGSCYTSSAGGYSVPFSSSTLNQNVKFKVLSEGTNVTVKNATSPYSTYVYESSTFEVWGMARANYTASNLTSLGQSISIQQSMALANKYIYSLESSYLPNIDVAFPYEDGSSSYIPSSNKIYIEQGDQFDWDVIQHEYGHYVQHYYNITASPGGSHSSLKNLADTKNDKDIGIRLAWGEGWATYFAINLQKEMSASSLNIPNVGDTYYQDVVDESNTYSWDVENLPSNRWLGEANEATVCAILYDMTDGCDSSEDDNIYISSSDIWNIIKNNHCKTLSEFVAAFYNSNPSPDLKYSLGSTLSRYKVAAAPNTPTGTGTNTPTFSWVAQGGSTKFPNNSFKLVFLNINYDPILSIPTNSLSVQLTSAQWKKIQNASSKVYYYIETCQADDNTPTGPYYSTLKTL